MNDKHERAAAYPISWSEPDLASTAPAWQGPDPFASATAAPEAEAAGSGEQARVGMSAAWASWESVSAGAPSQTAAKPVEPAEVTPVPDSAPPDEPRGAGATPLSQMEPAQPAAAAAPEEPAPSEPRRDEPADVAPDSQDAPRPPRVVGQHDEVPEDALTIGRSRSNVIVLDDMLVSRHHVVITADEGGLLLRDRGSRNGTYVNGRRVEHAHLTEGDRIGIGASTFEVRDGWLVSV